MPVFHHEYLYKVASQIYMAEGVSEEEARTVATHQVNPNPPKDTDGRREGSGRGWVRELQGRWPGVLG